MKLKRAISSLVVLFLGLFMIAGCSSQKPFETKDVSMSEAAQMMDEGQTFVLLFERDNCPFCSAMNEYIEKTKKEHPGLTVWKVDATSFEMYRENEGDMTLISNTDDGKALLSRFPYYLYTPAIYLIKDGVPESVGVGFDESKGTVSVWDTNSTIQWDQSKPEDLWTFIEKGQPQQKLAADQGQDQKTDESKPEQDQKQDSSLQQPHEESVPEQEEPPVEAEAPVTEEEPVIDESAVVEESDGAAEEETVYDESVIEPQSEQEFIEEDPEQVVE